MDKSMLSFLMDWRTSWLLDLFIKIPKWGFFIWKLSILRWHDLQCTRLVILLKATYYKEMISWTIGLSFCLVIGKYEWKVSRPVREIPIFNVFRAFNLKSAVIFPIFKYCTFCSSFTFFVCGVSIFTIQWWRRRQPRNLDKGSVCKYEHN